MKQFLIDIQPALTSLAEAIITALIAWGVVIFKQKTGIDIEDKYKRDLHDAALTGARAAIAKLGSGSAESPEAIESVLDHMQKSTGDAIKALEPETGVLTKIAVAKLELAKNEPKG